MKEKAKVFISCGKEDIEIGKRLYNDLEKNGIQPWMETKDRLPGQNNVVKSKAVRESDYFLTVISSQSLNSKGRIHADIGIAQEIQKELPETGIFIIPVRINDCELFNTTLHQLEKVDLFPDAYHSGFNRLLEVLKSGLNSVNTNIPAKKATRQAKSETTRHLKIAITALIILTVILVGGLFLILDIPMEAPVFTIDKPVMKPEGDIVIRAANQAANRKAPLMMRVDSVH